MARTDLTVEAMSRSGLQATYTAVFVDGHAFLNDGKRTFVHINNGITAFTLTVQTPQTVDGLAVAERTVSIGANEEHFLGPWPTGTYNQSDGKVYIDYSDTTDGTVAIVQVPTS